MNRQGLVGALLDINEQAINDLKKIIEEIPDNDLSIVIDPLTKDDNCKSIQTILPPVLHAGYGYPTSIHQLKEKNNQRPAKAFYTTIKKYMQDLFAVFTHTKNVFEEVKDDKSEQMNKHLKIKTGWKQLYDIKQITEHAIVHILRHKSQIEKFKTAINN